MAEKRTCEECGAELPPNAPQGICPQCLAKLAVSFASPAATIAPSLPSEAKTAFGRIRYFGDYELVEEIARGGMGVVYRARQVSLNRIVAVKMLLFGKFSSDEFVKRFHTEAEAAASLQHPNIVAIHEVGEQDGQHYFSMDYVAGKNLADLVRDNPLPAKRAAGYIRTIAEAIHYAHQRGILHRDLKPSNVLIDEFDQPRITDFGLAKQLNADAELTATGQVLGSPNYMPPEQADAKRGALGTHGDVYSLGAILYHLLTGRSPFLAETLEDTMRQLLNNEPVAPRSLNASVPRDLETICLKCLEKEPKRRYSSALKLADDLGRWLRYEPVVARPLSNLYRFQKLVRRNKLLFAAGTSIVALLLVVAIGAPLAAFRLKKAYQIETTLRKRAEFREKLTKAEALCFQFKFEEADRLMGGVEAPVQPWDAKDGAVLFRNLADYFARCGRWKEAAADAVRTLELEPDEVGDWISLAALLIANRDSAGYRNHCRAMLVRFGATKDPNYAQRIAKVCLLLPVTGEDLTRSSSLADSALSSGTSHWRDYTKGLAEYRQDRFDSAAKWTEQVLEKPGYPPAHDALAAQDCMVLALAHYQLNHTEEAHAALARGITIVETKLPQLETVEIGVYWVDWIIAQVLMNEAKALIEGAAANTDPSK